MPHPNVFLNISPATVSLSSETTASPGAAIVVLVLLAASTTALIIWLRMRKRNRARIAAMSPLEREQHDAVTEYQAQIAQAEKVLRDETRSRAARLKTTEKALANAHAIGARTLTKYRGKDGTVQVSGTEIRLSQGTFPLTAAVNATVDTAGNLATSSRSTLTRIAAGGLLFGPVGTIVGGVAKKTKMHDTRELYLLIAGEEFATLITCSPEDGQKARQFAVSVKQAALNADRIRQQRAQAVAQAEHALAAEQQNTTPLDGAREALQRVTADTTRVDAANRALSA